jgi:hypothetical protein
MPSAAIDPGHNNFMELHPCKRSPSFCLGPDHRVEFSENHMLCHTRHVGIKIYDKEKQMEPRRSWRGFCLGRQVSRTRAGLREPRSGAQELTCLNNIRCLPHSAQICYRKTFVWVFEAREKLPQTSPELRSSHSAHNRTFYLLHPSTKSSS